MSAKPITTPPPPPEAIRQARGCRPYVDEDGDIRFQLLDDDLKPFAEFTTDYEIAGAVIARMVNCHEKAAGLPRSDKDH